MENGVYNNRKGMIEGFMVDISFSDSDSSFLHGREFATLECSVSVCLSVSLKVSLCVRMSFSSLVLFAEFCIRFK